jgi:hypothetical protein
MKITFGVHYMQHTIYYYCTVTFVLGTESLMERFMPLLQIEVIKRSSPKNIF